MRPLVASLVAAAVITASAVSLAPAASADSPAESPVVNTDRLAVARQFVAAWGGRIKAGGREADTTTCDPGTVGADERLHTLRQINFARSVVGETPTTSDPVLSKKAQQAALVMGAYGGLTHTIDPSFKCWTQDAQDAASHSNLGFGPATSAIQEFLDDSDSSNTAVGHRRWVLCDQNTVMGDGDAASMTALWVISNAPTTPFASPRWAAWPSAGYFPDDIEPSGRWSLSVPTEGDRTDFSHASVKVIGPQGKALKVQKLLVSSEHYCGPTLAWDLPALNTGLSGIHDEIGTGTKTYNVTVSGIERDGQSVTVKYPVRLFDGFRRQVTQKPKLTGAARIGKTLRVSTLITSPKASKTSYRWYRGTKVLAHSRSYRLTARDLGHRITVRATATGGDTYWDAVITLRSAVVHK